MRVAIVGAGGLGSLYGGMLARSGLDVAFAARGRNLEALRASGLHVKLLSGDEFHVAVRASDDPRDIGPVDLIIFCVKTYDLVAAARQALPLAGAATLVVPIQNGVEASAQLAAIFGRERVLGGVAGSGATLVAPGRVQQKSPRVGIIVGEVEGGTSERVERLCGVFAEAGIVPRLSSDIRVEMWMKFAQASASFGLDALLRLPFGTIVMQPELGELFRGLVQEVVAVGRARGVPLPDGVVEHHWSGLVALVAANPDVHASMYYDLIAGRRLELDAVCGAVVRLGREVGVPTPLTFAVYAALTPFAAGPPAATPSSPIAGRV